MNTESAVDFPGRYRLHIALTVTDLEASKHFYELLLGEKPTKERSRYAKFEPADPSVNLALNEVDAVTSVAGGPSHFGIQVKSVSQVHDALERFRDAGIETVSEEGTTCCYAVQDKMWAVDPDGHKWEVFVVLEADVKDDLYEKSGCCAPERVPFAELGTQVARPSHEQPSNEDG